MKLTINQVAQCLDLPQSTVKRWVRQGRIPIQKSGSRYMFQREVLEKWAKKHDLLFSLPKEETVQKQELETLLTVMRRGGVIHHLSGNGVETVLKAAIEQITALPSVFRPELCERLIQRERLTSTGIGKGVAIPHPRIPLSDDLPHSLITTCFLDHPIEFGAVDNEPVFILFILLSPSPQCHLHLLSRLSFCVRDDTFIEFLKTCPAPEPFFQKIAHFEKQLNTKGMF